jgi:hypothetical protein
MVRSGVGKTETVDGNERLRAVADVERVAGPKEASVARNGIGEPRIREPFDRF